MSSSPVAFPQLYPYFFILFIHASPVAVPFRSQNIVQSLTISKKKREKDRSLEMRKKILLALTITKQNENYDPIRRDKRVDNESKHVELNQTLKQFRCAEVYCMLIMSI